jgi:mersacidin/lichenicidin family type 2 lantibiotic
MTTQNITRAWKDEEYRLSLSAAEKASLPINPAGVSELSDAQLKQAAGGGNIIPTSNAWCTDTCPGTTCSIRCL